MTALTDLPSSHHGRPDQLLTLAPRGPSPPGGRHPLSDHVRPAPHGEEMLVQRLRRLTRREVQVLSGLIAGLPVTLIATIRCRSISTVRSQVRAIREKLEVTSAREAVAVALRACGQEEIAFRLPLITEIHQILTMTRDGQPPIVSFGERRNRGRGQDGER